MYRIEHVKITGFWGKYLAEAKLHPNVNIFIGQNGSGKTTFMDLLQGVLRADLRILAAHSFSEINIKLSDNKHTRSIKVSKERGDEPVDRLRFQVGSHAFKFPAYSPEMDTNRHFRVRPRLEESFQELRNEISTLVKVSSLSVHRAAYEQVLDEEYPPRRRVIRPPIDERLDELTRALTSYQLSLAQQVAMISAEFQREVLTSFLYDNNFDTVTNLQVKGFDLNKSQRGLEKAYTDLRALKGDTSKKIAAHFEAIKKGFEAVSKYQKDEAKSDITIDDLLALPLLRRTDHIISLLTDADFKKQKVFELIETFLNTLKNFIKDKTLIITPRGELVVNKGDKTIPLNHLSSGEKQLLILLIETLLQRNEPFIFLADEPELSLHIEWQAQVISSIKKLNQNAQVVVATHSPEIAAGWKKNIIDMSEVIRG